MRVIVHIAVPLPRVSAAVDTGDPAMPGCNLTTWPVDDTYEAFMAVAGLRRVPIDPELPL